MNCAANGVAQIDLTFHHVPPGGRVRVFKIRHENLCAGIQRVDNHLAIGRPGDFDPAVLDVARDRCTFPVAFADLFRLRQEVEPFALIKPSLPFLPVLDGRQALYVTANSEQNIRDAVAWAERQSVRIVVQSGADVQRVAGLLKQHDVPVILTSILTLPPREDDFHAYPYQAAGVLAKAGVPFAFSSGGFQFSRDVPFQAGRAVAWGLSKDDAIKALTLDAARILGVDSQVGSIEAGKVANLVVISGDPLEVRSQIRHVVIAGRDLSLDNSHVALFKKYMAR